jgi:hypothetical protein
MTRLAVLRIWHLFLPEEVVWQERHRSAPGERSPAFSLKAVFWCAVAVGISLAIGNLV